jgi:hypothetical protein
VLVVQQFPDDVNPGTGEDAHGVGVVVAAGTGSLVGLGGPGVLWRLSLAKSQTVSRSCLSTAQRKATTRTLPDSRVEGATPAREASDSGWEAATGVADLGQQAGGAHGAGLGQAGEDVLVRVRVQRLSDRLSQRIDLGGDRGQGGHISAGDTGQGLPVVAGRAARGSNDALAKRDWVGASAVADAGKPGGQ